MAKIFFVKIMPCTEGGRWARVSSLFLWEEEGCWGYNGCIGFEGALLMWKIKQFFDGDYGCEELQSGQKPKVSVTLVDNDGNEKYSLMMIMTALWGIIL